MATPMFNPYTGNPYRENPYPPDEPPLPRCIECAVEVYPDDEVYVDCTGGVIGCGHCYKAVTAASRGLTVCPCCGEALEPDDIVYIKISTDETTGCWDCIHTETAGDAMPEEFGG